MSSYVEQLMAQARANQTGLGGNIHVSGGGFNHSSGVGLAQVVQHVMKLEKEIQVMAQVIAIHDQQLAPLNKLIHTGGAEVTSAPITMKSFSNPVDRSMHMINTASDDSGAFGEDDNYLSDYPEANKVIQEAQIQKTHYEPQAVAQEPIQMTREFTIGYPVMNPVTGNKDGNNTFTFNNGLLKSEDLKVVLGIKHMNYTDMSDESDDIASLGKLSGKQYPVLISNLDLVRVNKTLWVELCGKDMTSFVNNFVERITTTNDPQLLDYLLFINNILTNEVNNLIAGPTFRFTVDSFSLDIGNLTIHAKENLSSADYGLYKAKLEEIIGRVIFTPMRTFLNNIESVETIEELGFMAFETVVMLPTIAVKTGLDKVPTVETRLDLNNSENHLVKIIQSKNKESRFVILTSDDVEVVVRKDIYDDWYIRRV